jgi:prepilin signal peptidase PulO-like enzyme (type II secretory pathway)
MSLFILIIIFFLGACVGSFSAVLLEKNGFQRSFWTGRSHCMSCKKVLAWYELIPLVSYALQRGTCRHCGAMIPRWIWYVEWYMAFLWMLSAMVFSLGGLSMAALIIHSVILTWLSLLVIEDLRWGTISDTRSIPLIIGIACLSLLTVSVPDLHTLLPSPLTMLIGALVGMLFYMIQMMIPACLYAWKQQRYRDIGSIMLSPIIFPLWLVIKALLWEKKADTALPALSVFDQSPAWVGGGDIRLWIILGALAGPYYFFYVIMYGYALGTMYFFVKLFVTGERIQTLPVAPLVFFGLCVVWCLQIFA